MARILMTGASGVLGRVTTPRLREAGHELSTPGRCDLDLLSASQVRKAVAGSDAVLHLATHIPSPDRMDIPGAWDVNDRLRDGATRLLVDAALSAETAVIVVPTVAFVYPPGLADETTPPADVPAFLRSALAAEEHLRDFTRRGRRGVALRLGALYGPESGTATPTARYRAHLHTTDAATALTVAIAAPGGLYNVVDDGGGVSHHRFTAATGWRPQHHN